MEKTKTIEVAICPECGCRHVPKKLRVDELCWFCKYPKDAK